MREEDSFAEAMDAFDTEAKPRRVTLKMVADSAGCSVPTASKALTGAADISGSTRERVLSVASSLGYIPRARKSSMVRRVSSLTAAFDTYGSLYSSELLAGIMAATVKSGYELDCAVLPEDIVDGAVARQWINAKRQVGHLGAVLVTSELSFPLAEASAALEFPLVSIDPRSTVDPNIVSIGSTNWVGGATATEHLLGLGHRRIAFAGLDQGATFSLARFAGYQSVTERAGIVADPTLVFTGDPGYQDGFMIGERIAQMKDRPTAVVCVCDVVAFGVIEACRQRGLSVPRDLSVVGFDDVMPARWSSPGLTTIRQPLRRMGGLAVRTLLRLIEGKELDSNYVQLATNLIIRNSTAAPQATPR